MGDGTKDLEEDWDLGQDWVRCLVCVVVSLWRSLGKKAFAGGGWMGMGGWGMDIRVRGEEGEEEEEKKEKKGRSRRRRRRRRKEAAEYSRDLFHLPSPISHLPLPDGLT